MEVHMKKILMGLCLISSMAFASEKEREKHSFFVTQFPSGHCKAYVISSGSPDKIYISGRQMEESLSSLSVKIQQSIPSNKTVLLHTTKVDYVDRWDYNAIVEVIKNNLVSNKTKVVDRTLIKQLLKEWMLDSLIGEKKLQQVMASADYIVSIKLLQKRDWETIFSVNISDQSGVLVASFRHTVEAEYEYHLANRGYKVWTNYKPIELPAWEATREMCKNNFPDLPWSKVSTPDYLSND